VDKGVDMGVSGGDGDDWTLDCLDDGGGGRR